MPPIDPKAGVIDLTPAQFAALSDEKAVAISKLSMERVRKEANYATQN
jgi:hypothetical protein